jgi:tetratricopeptide (TPR) repeat protein
LALAEQFAGLFDDAASHNLEALALAEEISAVDDIGLLSANLCLTLRQTDRLIEGLAYGRKGAEVLKSLQIQRQEGQARNRIGHTLLALHRWDDADAAYADALAVWEPLQHPNRYEAVAGRAVAAFHLNRRDEALALIDEALSFVEHEGLQGIVEPVLLLLNCAAVLRRVGQAERAQGALQRAETWLRAIAGRISDEGVRQSFVNRPDNRELERRLGTTLAESCP